MRTILKKIRTAILGYGRNGSSMHAGAIEKNESFEMVAVCDIDPERRKQAKNRFNCMIYDDYHKMLENEQLDLVSIITRSDQHCQMACDCLEAGVNVLVTKPLAVNEAEAWRMAGTADKNNRLLLPWLPACWSCDLARLKQLIAGKVIGNVFLIRRSVSTFATRNDWQTERRYGGGYLLNWGPHIIEPPVLLMDSEVKSVYGQMKQTINPGDAEDLFIALINLADGTIIQVEHTISAENLPDWFIQGDRGTIIITGRNLKIVKNDPSRPDDPTKYGEMTSAKKEVIEEILQGNTYGDENEIYVEVASAIRGEKAFPVTPVDAIKLSHILEAIRLSDDENRVILF